MMRRFADRHEAGVRLADELRAFAGRPDTIVLGLPRGGVPVAFEVARALGAPLDVMVVRKLGVPGHEELAMGALASGSPPLLNQRLIGELGIPSGMVEQVIAREAAELARREARYRAGRGPLDLVGRRVILVDDGLATGSTMLAAATAVQNQRPKAIVVAVPVAATDACRLLHDAVDACVAVATPFPFHAVGAWYHDFTQTTDEEVIELLRDGASAPAGAGGGP